MSALTTPIEDGVRSYLELPVNFNTDDRDLIEADAFRAGAEWAEQHTDWRVLGNLIPGHLPLAWVHAGDRIRIDNVEGVVLSNTNDQVTDPELLHVILRTDRGGQIAYHRWQYSEIQVLAAMGTDHTNGSRDA